jgi:hypothetical protein
LVVSDTPIRIEQEVFPSQPTLTQQNTTYANIVTFSYIYLVSRLGAFTFFLFSYPKRNIDHDMSGAINI